MGKIKTAVIGVGSFGQHHARVVSESEKADLVAIVDFDEDRGKEIAGRNSVDFTKDYLSVAKKLDAAVVVTPTSSHFHIASDLLQRGIHTFIEKPIAENAEEGKQLVDMAEKRGLVLQVGHIERFNPAFRAVRGLIDRPLYIEARRMSPFPERIRDADVITDMMIHDIDISLHLLNSEITDIRAIGMKLISDRLDIVQARIEFDSGTVVNLFASRVNSDRLRQLIIIEKKRQHLVNFLDKRSFCTSLSDTHDKSITCSAVEFKPEEPLKVELNQFFKAIDNKNNDGVSGEEATKVISVAERIREVISGSD